MNELLHFKPKERVTHQQLEETLAQSTSSSLKEVVEPLSILAYRGNEGVITIIRPNTKKQRRWLNQIIARQTDYKTPRTIPEGPIPNRGNIFSSKIKIDSV